MVPVRHRLNIRLLRPAPRVADPRPPVLVAVRREGLVARAEIEDLPRAALPRAAAAEDFAAAEPTDEDQLVRLGDVEVLTVHLFVLDDEVIGDALGNRMAGLGHPQNFFQAVL